MRELMAGEVAIGGITRTFTVSLPQHGAAAQHGAAPLLLALHGNSPAASGRVMRGWTTFGQQPGFAIAYPDGFEGCWADGRGVTTADEAGIDDVAFLRAVIDWSAERHGTWPDRAVAAGISNGAFMAQRLALEASDQVAVLAAVAGGMPASLHETEPTHAVSALLIHGTADPITPIEGGYSRHLGPNGELRGRTLSLDETAARWRTIDRCPPGPGETHSTDQSSRHSTGGGIGGTRVTTWTVFGGGHSWPGSANGLGTAAQEFDAAKEICRFAEPLLRPADERQR